MEDLDRFNARKCFSIFRDSINKDDAWICYHKEKPEPNKACWVLIFEPMPFIGLDYQIRVMTYNPVDDTFIDVINGLKTCIDSPVCTYWKYVR